MRSTFIFSMITGFLLVTKLAAQVPNPGFEDLNYCNLTANWSYTPLQVIIVDSIGNEYTDSVVYDSVPYYTWPSPDAHSGNYSLCIRNAYSYTSSQVYPGKSDAFEDTSSCSAFFNTLVPISSNPSGLSFWHKFTPVGNDTAYCYAALYDSNGVEIANAIHHFIQPQNTFSPVEVPFNYLSPGNAAYYSVKFSNVVVDYNLHEAHLGTRLYIDDINLNHLNGIDPQDEVQVNIYPNPATTGFRINGNTEIQALRMLNINGELVKIFNINDQLFDISEMPAGIYLLEITGKNTTSVLKIIRSYN